eukprot:7344395-Pyramimonas_sp.AAC.1
MPAFALRMSMSARPLHASRPHRELHLRPQWEGTHGTAAPCRHTPHPHGGPAPCRHTVHTLRGLMRRSTEGGRYSQRRYSNLPM